MNLSKLKLGDSKMQDKYNIGDFAIIKKVFTTAEVKTFAEISLDVNPIHLDEAAAKNSVFGARIVHGMLVGSLFSALIANKLPGPGSIYLHQELNFKKPVYHGQEITAKVVIVDIRQDKPIFTLNTICTNEQQEVVIEGKAVVLKK